MSSHAEIIADGIARWTGLSVKLPADLVEAIGVLEAVRWAEVRQVPAFDLTGITAENAADRIAAYALEITATTPAGGAVGYTPRGRAKAAAVEAAARRVVVLAPAAVEDIVGQLQPEFEKAAAAYVQAVTDLPADLTAEALVAGGAGAVTSYAAALREVPFLNTVDQWVLSLNGIPGVSGTGSVYDLTALRILAPGSREDLSKLDAAVDNAPNSTVGDLNPVFFAAAKLDVPFEIHTLKQAQELRDDLEAYVPVSAVESETPSGYMWPAAQKATA